MQDECASALIAAQIDVITHIRSLSSLGRPRAPALEHESDALGLVDFHGFLIPHPQIHSVVTANRARIRRSHSRAVLPPVSVSITMTEPMVLRGVGSVVESISDIAPSVFVSVFWRSRIVFEKAMALRDQYMAIQGLWRGNCEAVDCHNVVSHDWTEDETWGPEQKYAPSKPYEGREITEGLAEDTPMVLDPVLRRAFLFSDRNRMVVDPVAAHMEFRRRVVWTPEESAIFREKWALWPHKFHQIAAFLPHKCVKDLVEHYYLTKDREFLASPRKALKPKNPGDG
jgi:hypothetical protein